MINVIAGPLKGSARLHSLCNTRLSLLIMQAAYESCTMLRYLVNLGSAERQVALGVSL